jgi:two-component system, sensor histidine kinase and response regulator
MLESDVRRSEPRRVLDLTNEVHDSPDGPLVLVVDDDAMNRTVLSAMLRQFGYRFHFATNGREAVDATRREAYAAVLMDCLMPEMDGYEAARTIREDEQAMATSGGAYHVPVIAVTAVAIHGARERCIAAGMDDYLSKPVVKQSVGAVLDRWVAKAGGQPSWTPRVDAERAAPDAGLVDRTALATLRELDPENGDEFMVEVVNDFLMDVEPRFAAMRAAIAEHDMSGLVQELHSIAGCAALVGATQVERIARSRQAHEGTNEAEHAGDLVDRLEDSFIRTRAALESMVRLLAPPAR